jgi:hypothetical protein
MLLFVSTSCSNSTVETISDSSIQTEAQTEPAIEYKTIEPPEDGWTLELLNEVTYINGKDIDLPFCLNDLGDDFTFVESIAPNNGVHVGMIHYKGKQAFVVVSSQAGDEFDRYDIIDEFELGSYDNLSSLDLSDFLIVNGVSLSSSMNDIYNKLGIDDYYSIKIQENDPNYYGKSLYYYIDNFDSSLSMFFANRYDNTNNFEKPLSISINLEENSYE